MENQSYIVLRRYAKWVYKIRKFDIVIDDQKVDSIGNGQEKIIPVTPGQHSVELRVSWIIKSQIQTININPGEKVLLECGCPIPLWHFLILGAGSGLLFSKGLLLLFGFTAMLIIKAVITLGAIAWSIYLYWGRGKFLELRPPEKL